MTLQVQCQVSLQQFTLAIDLQLPARGITALIGASGCGKTTLLEVIAGLRKAHHASVSFRQQDWMHLSMADKRLGLVLQKPILFPHLTVAENLNYGLKRASQQFISAPDVISECGLQELLQQYPAQLSGGQQQRVAFARALLAQPQLLILDEPFSALDESSRRHMVHYLRRLSRQHELPVIWVSHQLSDVIDISDYLVHLDAGKVRSHGELVTQLQREPLRSQLALSVLRARVTAPPGPVTRDLSLRIGNQQLYLPRPAYVPEDTDYRLRVYARDVSLTLAPVLNSSVQNQLHCEVVDSFAAQHPAECLVKLALADTSTGERQTLYALITRAAWQQLQLAPGRKVIAHLKAAALHEPLREAL